MTTTDILATARTRALTDLEWRALVELYDAKALRVAELEARNAEQERAARVDLEDAERRVTLWRRTALDTTHAQCEARIVELEATLRVAAAFGDDGLPQDCDEPTCKHNGGAEWCDHCGPIVRALAGAPHVEPPTLVAAPPSVT